jgi:hypothetical protein
MPTKARMARLKADPERHASYLARERCRERTRREGGKRRHYQAAWARQKRSRCRTPEQEMTPA